MLRAYKTPIFAKGQKLTHSPAHVETRRTGDTTTLHSLTPAPAFEGRVSTHHLHSTPARPADPNTYTRYLVLLSMRSRVLFLGGSSCMVKMRPKLPLHGTAKK